MTRLIDSTKNPLARELLRAAEMDKAPENTAAKVALALGLGSTAVVATIATSAAAASSLASGTSSTLVASAVAAAPGAGVAVAAPVAVGAAASVAAAAPVAAGALSAVGMLKVMAAVSLACGTLSYGGVKLALKVTEKPTSTQHTQWAQPSSSVPRTRAKAATRSVGAFAPLEEAEAVTEANLPAPPPPPNHDVDDVGNVGDVAAARGHELRPSVSAPPETNAAVLGRQNIPVNGREHAAIPIQHTGGAVAASAPPQAAVAVAHTAAFPSEENHPGSAANPPPVPNANPQVAASGLEREVAQLDHARAALSAGQPVQALRELDTYRAQTPKGVLAAESVVLRVKALLALGQRRAAEAAARPMLVNAPHSRHAERLRELLGTAANTQ